MIEAIRAFMAVVQFSCGGAFIWAAFAHKPTACDGSPADVQTIAALAVVLGAVHLVSAVLLAGDA